MYGLAQALGRTLHTELSAIRAFSAQSQAEKELSDISEL